MLHVIQCVLRLHIAATSFVKDDGVCVVVKGYVLVPANVSTASTYFALLVFVYFAIWLTRVRVGQHLLSSL